MSSAQLGQWVKRAIEDANDDCLPDFLLTVIEQRARAIEHSQDLAIETESVLPEEFDDVCKRGLLRGWNTPFDEEI